MFSPAHTNSGPVEVKVGNKDPIPLRVKGLELEPDTIKTTVFHFILSLKLYFR